MIDTIAELVEAACARESNVFGYSIWTHHITKVAAKARKLASLFGADPEIVEVAALLHDYASVKDQALYAEHHIHGPREAEKVLQALGYPLEKIEAVKHCIATHRGSVPVMRETPEALCLANADAATHIEQVAALLYLAYVHKGMGVDEGAAWVLAKLQRSWQKLHPLIQTQMLGQYKAACQTLAGVPDPNTEAGEPGADTSPRTPAG